MTKCCKRTAAVLLVVLGGCVSLSDEALPSVASNPFNPNPQPAVETTIAGQAPGNEEVSRRVAVVGQKIVAINPSIAMQPRFMTVGSPDVLVTHVGTNDIYVSEGMATRCTTDGQLAAVLCEELGKMIAQREILAHPVTRMANRRPPADVQVGASSTGFDPSHMAELAQYERDRQRDVAPLPPPDPALLARGYLEKAGYTADDLESVAPLLRASEANGKLYRQIQASQGPVK